MSKLKKITGMSTVINPLRKKDGIAFRNVLKWKIYMWNRKYTTFLVTCVFSQLAFLAVCDARDENKSSGAANLSSIQNLSRPRRFYSSRSTLQMHTVRLLSTQASVPMSIKKLVCFQCEFSEVSTRHLQKFVSIYYISISRYT